MHGWICPKCQGGNAPTTTRCPCSPVIAAPVLPYPGWPATPSPQPFGPFTLPYTVTCTTGSLSVKADPNIRCWN